MRDSQFNRLMVDPCFKIKIMKTRFYPYSELELMIELELMMDETLTLDDDALEVFTIFLRDYIYVIPTLDNLSNDDLIILYVKFIGEDDYEIDQYIKIFNIESKKCIYPWIIYKNVERVCSIVN